MCYTKSRSRTESINWWVSTEVTLCGSLVLRHCLWSKRSNWFCIRFHTQRGFIHMSHVKKKKLMHVANFQLYLLILSESMNGRENAETERWDTRKVQWKYMTVTMGTMVWLKHVQGSSWNLNTSLEGTQKLQTGLSSQFDFLTKCRMNAMLFIRQLWSPRGRTFPPAHECGVTVTAETWKSSHEVNPRAKKKRAKEKNTLKCLVF